VCNSNHQPDIHPQPLQHSNHSHVSVSGSNPTQPPHKYEQESGLEIHKHYINSQFRQSNQVIMLQVLKESKSSNRYSHATLTHKRDRPFSTQKYYERFYDILSETVVNSITSDMALTLTGGWDCRCIAGILAENNIVLPTITHTRRMELVIASKIAHTLGLPLYSYGDQKVMNAFMPLNKAGWNNIRYILSGYFFDEINASGSGLWVKNYRDFLESQEYALSLRFDALSSYYQKQKYFKLIFPILNENVLSCLSEIPYKYRVKKQIQRWILKTHFPKLWKIPYSNSIFLPSDYPFKIHCLLNSLRRFRFYYFLKLLTKI